LSQPASLSRTCTIERRLSQIRGGLNMTRGPTSRMSARTVAASSGKLSVKPACRPHAMETICSPIQASGRKLTYSSSRPMGSTDIRLDPIQSRFSWLSIASFGFPVVPDVVQRMAVSLARPAATSASSQPGRSTSSSAPRRSSSSNATSRSTA